MRTTSEAVARVVPLPTAARHRLEEVERIPRPLHLEHCVNVTVESANAISAHAAGRALRDVIAAHPALRSTVDAAGFSPAESPEAIDIPVSHAPSRQAAYERARASNIGLIPPESPVRLRAEIVEFDASAILVIAVDPLVCDAWSANIIAQEVMAALAGDPATRSAPDEWSASLAHRVAWLESDEGAAARVSVAARAAGADRRWWRGDEFRLGAADTSADARLDLDDDDARALLDECRRRRVSIFHVGIAAMALLDPEPIPRLLTSTFAARSTEDEFGAVGHFATDVPLVVTPREGSFWDLVRGIRSEAYAALEAQWIDVADLPPADASDTAGATVSLLFLPSTLTGAGGESDDGVLTRGVVDICPSGADIDLFLIERPPADGEGASPVIRLCALVSGGDLDAAQIVDRWGAALRAAAREDWDAIPARASEYLRLDPIDARKDA